jgi:hypothetical protein
MPVHAETKRSVVHVERRTLRACVILVGFLLASTPMISRASTTSASDIVHHLFSALVRHDYPTALSMTAGSAAITLALLLSSADREASHAHAHIELVVRDLRLREEAADGAGRVPVDAHYDLAIFGKRSIFRVLARRLIGTTQFIVSDQRIVSFGSLSAL